MAAFSKQHCIYLVLVVVELENNISTVSDRRCSNRVEENTDCKKERKSLQNLNTASVI